MKLSILFLFLFLFSSSIFAAKFGVVDVQKVLRNSKPALNARSELEKKVSVADINAAMKAAASDGMKGVLERSSPMY